MEYLIKQNQININTEPDVVFERVFDNISKLNNFFYWKHDLSLYMLVLSALIKSDTYQYEDEHRIVYFEYNIDGNKMLGFVDDPYFKRRKVSYFMKESVPRRNKIIPGTNLYVWVNNNANTLVRLMRDMLVRYLISPETMTLYLRRDLSSLH